MTTTQHHPKKLILRLLVAVAVMAGVVGLGAEPSGAVAVGPCEFALDHPHKSTQMLTGQQIAVVRSHSRYYCTSQVLYVNAQVTLHYCLSAGQDPSTCAKVGEHAGTHTFSDVNYNAPNYRILTTTDSDPFPESGWYVATAVYEVCVFNGGVFPGFAQSPWVHYDADKRKTDATVEKLPNIVGDLPDIPPDV